MSENFLRLIPTDPLYLPPSLSQKEIKAFLRATFPKADEIRVIATEEVMFVDPGTNLEKITCPNCHTLLSMDWWSAAMDRAYGSHFANLTIIVPCCSTTTTLNDLCYEWPAGFARFLLEIRNPGAELKQGSLHHFEQVLKCRLRIIWAHL
jgi:hypothetical protein